MSLAAGRARIPTPARCVVIGAGLAGAAAAASFARRGWQVRVLDAAASPAQGASALPAGLMAPHQSLDDNLLSQLTREGIRATWAQVQALLPAGEDWAPTGVLENRLDDSRPPPALGESMRVWTREADPAQKSAAGLPPASGAWWHERAAWIKPRALVRAWLQQPGIELQRNSRVQSLQPGAGTWVVRGEGEAPLAEAELVVVAAALGSAPLLPRPVALHPVRGQVSWSHDAVAEGELPLNGNGHYLPRVLLDGGLAWLTGSTFVRGDTDRGERAEEHVANLERLRALAPAAAERLAPLFEGRKVNAWAGIRCASSDRRPLVGFLAPGLAVSTAMGSRGLTFAALCGELLAARVHGEPLPIEERLADALDVARLKA